MKNDTRKNNRKESTGLVIILSSIKKNDMIKIVLSKLLLLTVIFGYGQDRQDNINSYFKSDKFKEFKREINGVEIRIDPRIEFFQVLNLAARNPAINTNEMDYKLDIIQYFDNYKNHPALRFIRNNYTKFFNSIDAPYSFILSLNNDFTFSEGLVNNSWQNLSGINDFLNMMRLFLVETDFVSFFNAHDNFYEIVLDNTIFTLNDFDEKNRMMNYFGIEQTDEHTFCLILNSLGFGNFGKAIHTVAGEEHYAIVTATSSNGSIPVFEKDKTLALIWHEFSHSCANPLIDKYWNDFENLSFLHEPIKQSMAGQFYHDWHSVVYEHLVRAITCRLAAGKYSEDFAEMNLSRLELGQKFIYTVPLISALKEYEKSRNKYPTLESFMPDIVRTMKSVNQDDIENWICLTQQIREPDVSDIPSMGEIYSRENRLLILSTCEQDSIADKRLKEFVKQSHSNYTIIADTTALKMDLSNYNLFAIGTPWGNKFIEKYITLLPVKITLEGLIAQKMYKGKGYAFLTGWINPFNASNVMVLYTAQNPDDLVNFTWIPRGSTDYQITKDLITLKAGNYKRHMKIWSCN